MTELDSQSTAKRRRPGRLKVWLVNGPLSSALLPVRIRRAGLRAFGVEVGKSSIGHSGLIVGDLENLKIGSGVVINTGFSLHPTGGITVGDRVFMGPRVTVVTGTHAIGESTQRASTPTVFSPVSIGRGSWIGAGVIVCPGVVIGPGCVVAPGAVVTGDLEADSFYAGVPAKLKRRL